jgi:hypothetical protein
MYLTIIILPLLGSIVSGFFGRKIGVTGSQILTTSSILITTILAIISFFEIGFNDNSVSIYLFKWLDSESFNIFWNFQFDSLTVSMLLPVLVISTLVHFYSIGYMSHDPHNQRFFSYLSLFTFMMIILVTGNNYLLMFVGWEGVGICSYLLVSFWFTRIAANQSSLAALLTNRIGDSILTLGMFIMLWAIGTLDYNQVFSLSPYINENVLVIIGVCLLIGAMAKSSQVGLHIWLPMAMEGPTPVSALIHAATMVTAGVYLLIRSSPLIEYSSTILLICLWLGAITTVFSSLIGLFQQDIKKIIAYSTMSPSLAQKCTIYFTTSNHQTICEKINIKNFLNSLITKAHDYIHNHIYYNFFNSFIILWLHNYLFLYVTLSVKWKTIIFSKLVGISEAIRLILIFAIIMFNLLKDSFVFIIYRYLNFNVNYILFCMLLRPKNFLKIYWIISSRYSTQKSFKVDPDLYIKEWISGLIDGNGYFKLTKKEHASFEIVLHIRDIKVLNELKHRYGGTVKSIGGAYAAKYRLRHNKGLILLINDINGLLRNPARLLQINKLCTKYNIVLKNPKPLTFYNGWLSGFIDSEGSVYYDEGSKRVFIAVMQKNRYLLEPLVSIYGGKIEILSPKTDAFKYVISRKKELRNLTSKYLDYYPLKTEKRKRIKLIENFYNIIEGDKTNAEELNEWVKFQDKWEKYQDW